MTAPQYLYRLPVPGDVPAGKVVCHNQVVVGLTPHRRPGVSGFRVWLADADSDGLVACACPWAPSLRGHFRVLATVTA